MSKNNYEPKVKQQLITMSPQKKSTRVYLPEQGALLSVEVIFTSLNHFIGKLNVNKTEIIAYNNEGTKIVILTLRDKRSSIFGDHLW
jgi:hypothetical protein